MWNIEILRDRELHKKVEMLLSPRGLSTLARGALESAREQEPHTTYVVRAHTRVRDDKYIVRIFTQFGGYNGKRNN